MKRGVSGDQVLAAAVIAVVAFLLGLAASPVAVLDGIRHFPAPTAAWATIVTGLAWPVVVLVVAWRGRSELTIIFAHLARRFGSDDIEFSGLKLSANDSQTNVGDDPTKAAVHILFQDAGRRDEVDQWMAINSGPSVDRVAFATKPAYIDLRRKLLDHVKASR